MNLTIIIVVIAIAVYILASLFGGDEDKARPKPRQGNAGRPPAQKPVADIDRFLDEMNRRRRQAERRGPTLPDEPAPRPRPVPQVKRPPVARPMAPPRYEAAPPPSLLVPPPPPVAVPIANPVAARIVRPVGAAVLAKRQNRPTEPPAIQQVLALMKTPTSLQTAFLLQEILSPPRCRRPHHSGWC